jgi:hypothetical protein
MTRLELLSCKEHWQVEIELKLIQKGIKAKRATKMSKFIVDDSFMEYISELALLSGIKALDLIDVTKYMPIHTCTCKNTGCNDQDKIGKMWGGFK